MFYNLIGLVCNFQIGASNSEATTSPSQFSSVDSPLKHQPNLPRPCFIFPELLGNLSGRDDNISSGNSTIAIPELLGNISGRDDTMSCDSCLDRLYLDSFNDDIPEAFTITLKPSSSGFRDDLSRASIDNINQVMPMALGEEGNESMTGYDSCDDSSASRPSIDNRLPPVDDDTVLSQSTVQTFSTKATFSDIFSRLGHTLQADQEYFTPPSTAAMTGSAPPLGELVGLSKTHGPLLLKKDQATPREIVESFKKVYMVASIALAVETEKQDNLLWFLLKNRYGRSVPTSVIESVSYKNFLKSCDTGATGAVFDSIGFEVYVMFDSLKRIFLPTELDMMDCLIVAMTRRCFLPEVGTSDTTSQSSLEPNDGKSSPGTSQEYHNRKLQLLEEYKKESDIVRYSHAYIGQQGIWHNVAVWKRKKGDRF